MLARIAHELYWIGRQLSRAEHTARHARRRLPRRRAGPPPRRRRRAALVGSRCSRSWAASRPTTPASRDDVSRGSRSTPTHPASVLSCVTQRARGRAHGARRVLGRDVGGDQHLPPRPAAARHVRRAAHRPVLGLRLRARALRPVLGRDRAARCCATRRTRSWRRARAIEAGDMVLRMLRVALPAARARRPTPRDGQALALLQAVGGFQAFRRAVPAPPNAEPGRLASCSTSAPTRTRSRSRSRRCTTR